MSINRRVRPAFIPTLWYFVQSKDEKWFKYSAMKWNAPSRSRCYITHHRHAFTYTATTPICPDMTGTLIIYSLHQMLFLIKTGNDAKP